MSLSDLMHRVGSGIRNSGALRNQRWLWQFVEPIWNGAFKRVYARKGYPAHINGEVFRLEYEYGSRFDQKDNRNYEPAFYHPFVSQIREGMTIYDIGAHIGIFTIGAGVRVGCSGKVLAFEPAPETIDKLKLHIAFNNLENIVEIVPAVVSDSNAGAKFFAYKASMAALISRQNVEDLNPERRSEPAREITVDSVTIDGLLASRNLRPAVIKIDVEGAELMVLRGARRVLAECKPIILCEVHPPQMKNCGASTEEFTAFLAEVGYLSEPLDEPNSTGIYHALLRPSGSQVNSIRRPASAMSQAK